MNINDLKGFNVLNSEFQRDVVLLQGIVLEFIQKHKIKGIRAILDNEHLQFSIANDSAGVDSWKMD